jgi:hypothetical protein
MKILLNALLLSLVSILSFYASQVIAEPAQVFKEDNTCSSFIPNGETENGLPGLDGGPWIGDTHAVGRDAGGDVFPGSGKLTCQGNHYVDLQRAHIGKGAPCIVPATDQPGCFFVTLDTITVATPSGEAHLTCQFKKNGTIVFCP